MINDLHRGNGNHMRDGNVYFVRDEYGNVKIGVSQDIEKRIKALQTSNASRLELILNLHVNDITHAYKIENELHKIFEHCRVRNEWYNEQDIRALLGKDLSVGGYEFRDIDEILCLSMKEVGNKTA